MTISKKKNKPQKPPTLNPKTAKTKRDSSWNGRANREDGAFLSDFVRNLDYLFALLRGFALKRCDVIFFVVTSQSIVMTS